MVIDKRPHIGGNIYCENVVGINVHKYGAHIFHTSNQEVWKFVNSFVAFNRYTNSPVANYKGKLYNLPFNMNTFNQIWGTITPEEAADKIEEQRAQVKKALIAENITEPRNLEEQALMLIGRDIYETLIKGYTEKQWGRKCTELPPFIIKRLPVRLVYDNNYFNDLYQGIPIGGYNHLINSMLEGIDTRVNVDFFSNRYEWEALADTVVYTGKIDEFFDYCYGRLDYRSLRFEHEIVNSPNYQGNAVINYTDADTPFTRIIEHKHFEMFGQQVYENPQTVISREYPIEWQEGIEPYYPINDNRNNILASQYREKGTTEHNVIFGGRLAEYKYYDMAPVIESVINWWDKQK